ncbi:hypothetical protein Q3G72_029316 [Acer saccharum]|nr:hypothetical protein Q3G72_029316 [Acer saccharum]
MCVDGPIPGSSSLADGSWSSPPTTPLGPVIMGDTAHNVVEVSCGPGPRPGGLDTEQSDHFHLIPGSQAQGKKWKWAAREAQKKDGQSDSSVQPQLIVGIVVDARCANDARKVFGKIPEREIEE